jgi:hypothetical protein
MFSLKRGRECRGESFSLLEKDSHSHRSRTP